MAVERAPAGTRSSIAFSRQDRFMAALLVFVAGSLGARQLAAPAWLQFLFSVAAIIPLASFIGAATEHLADRAGSRVGGLLNATFGNAPDLLVGVFGVQKGLIPLVKATLVGALISNSALIMGVCCVAAGLRYRAPEFRRAEAGHHSLLMILTVAAILFPSVGSFALCGSANCAPAAQAATILHLSVGIALALMVAYLAYLVYSVLGWQTLRPGAPQPVSPEETIEQRTMIERTSGRPIWPAWLGVLVLVLATALLVPVTDSLTSNVVPVTHVLGWSQVFVGMIVVANAGNVAEGYAAIRLAFQKPGTIAECDRTGQRDTGLDLALGIASASSIQIATFVAPLVVLYSLMAHPMNLAFSPIEIAILGLLAVVFAHVAQDGESNWLEGVQLLTLYLMSAIVFYTVPATAFGG